MAKIFVGFWQCVFAQILLVSLIELPFYKDNPRKLRILMPRRIGYEILLYQYILTKNHLKIHKNML